MYLRKAKDYTITGIALPPFFMAGCAKVSAQKLVQRFQVIFPTRKITWKREQKNPSVRIFRYQEFHKKHVADTFY